MLLCSNRHSTGESTPLKRLSNIGETDSEDSSSVEDDVPIQNRCTHCRRSEICSFTLYVWLVVFMLGCFFVMMVTCVVIVGPFHRVWFPWDHVLELHQCSCDKWCKSADRCLLITVTVTAVKARGTCQLRSASICEWNLLEETGESGSPYCPVLFRWNKYFWI